MIAPPQYGVTRTAGHSNAQDSKHNERSGRNNDDRPARGVNQGKDAGVQTTDSILNFGAGGSVSGSGNQQDNQGKGKGKNKKNNNQDNNEGSNEGSSKEKDQENNKGGKKNKNNKENSNQNSDPQAESSKVNDTSDDANDKTKNKGKAKAKDDNEPQDSGTRTKKDVHFSEKEKKEDKKNGDAETVARAEQPLWENATPVTDQETSAAGEGLSEWDTNTGDDSATAANEGNTDWDPPADDMDILGFQCKSSHFRTRDWNPNTRQGRRRRWTRSNTRAWNDSYEENERNTRPVSCEPVLGRNGYHRHWACDSNGRFSLRSRAEIEEHYQPGQWEEDGIYEYFRSYRW